jgi:multidrug resistance efflux pump
MILESILEMPMKKFSLIHIVALLVGVILVISFSFKMNTTVTFYGFAENKETQINMENPVEVNRIHVTTGQKVKKGDVIIDVSSSILPIKINDAVFSIEELKTRYELWKLDLDGRISEREILLNEKSSAIQAQIDQQYAQLDKELKYSKTSISTQINNLKNERYVTNNPMLSRIKILEKELSYFTIKKEKETILAPSDGLIGNIHCKEDEKISSFSPLVTFYEESPTLVIGYIHEDLLLKVNLLDEVTVFSTSRPDIQNTGIIKTLGSRIVEIPPRIRKIKELKTYGREVIIEIPPDNPFLQKEKVTLTLNQ